jgi:hypothetical protein
MIHFEELRERENEWEHHTKIRDIQKGGNQYKKNYTAMKIPLMHSFSGNSAASTPISTSMCL